MYNFQQYRHIQASGWTLGWTWAKKEMIWSAIGSQATKQGDCSKFKGDVPHCCKKDPPSSIYCLGLLISYNQQIANCCKGGVITSWAQDPDNAVSSFQLPFNLRIYDFQVREHYGHTFINSILGMAKDNQKQLEKKTGAEVRVFGRKTESRDETVMVSIRRRRLLGLCSGRNTSVVPFPKFCENEEAPENLLQNSKPDNLHPIPSKTADPLDEKTDFGTGPGSSDSTLSKEHQSNQFPEVKPRKRHRRKQSEHHEPFLMRGVYFKNMKWQAAIKVDKKQIHLGTVGSQEEAARLYDRAAFMCGREPNFELLEEEKQELRQIKWEDFLVMTRSAITNKKPRKKKVQFHHETQEVHSEGDS